MKQLKTFVLAIAVVATLTGLTACKQNQGGQNIFGKEFLNDKQKADYDSFLDSLFNGLQNFKTQDPPEMDINNVAGTILYHAQNKGQQLKYIIVDIKSNEPLNANTSRKDLEKRFIPLKF